MNFKFLLKSIFVIALFLSMANFVFAEMVKNAGFTSNTILVSNSAPNAGDIVRMSMPIYNESGGTLYGNVRIYQDGQKLSEKSIVLKVGEFGGFSFEWKAVAGVHDFDLKLEDTSIQLPKQNKTIVVLDNRLSEITIRTQGSSPAITTDGELFKEYNIGSEAQASPTDTGIDSYRQDFLYEAEVKINSIKQDINESVKQNTEYEKRLNNLKDSLPRADGSLLTPLQYVYAWFLSAVAYILANVYLFYGVVALLVLLILRFFIRKFRRRHHAQYK